MNGGYQPYWRAKRRKRGFVSFLGVGPARFGSANDSKGFWSVFGIGPLRFGSAPPATEETSGCVCLSVERVGNVTLSVERIGDVTLSVERIGDVAVTVHKCDC